VLDEAAAGDPFAANERLEILAAMTVLAIKPEALELAKELVQAGALPAKAVVDATHIAIAATHGISFLLTWNCRHMANASLRPLIESVCAVKRYKAPVVCTPEELMEASS
jgi:hypothetical protein